MGSFIQRHPELIQEMLTPMYEQHEARMEQISITATFRHHIPTSVSSQQLESSLSLRPIPVSAFEFM
jgi:hypothetical protein